MLSCRPLIQYYIFVASSPVGLETVSPQTDSHGPVPIIAYGNQALSPTEQWYSQRQRDKLKDKQTPAVAMTDSHFYL